MKLNIFWFRRDLRLNDNTGFMHNRVKMITAGFLCKHLLIDWRGVKLILLRNCLIMNSHQIMATGNGQQVQAAMLLLISEFLILIRSNRNSIPKMYM